MNDAQSESLLHAGAALLEITPKLGTQIGGKGLLRPVRQVIDPLFARALILQRGAQKFCILTLDVLAIERQWADRIRQEVAACYDFAVEGVMVHALQTHAAPLIGHMQMRSHVPAEHAWLTGGDDAFTTYALERSVAAVGMAAQQLYPVHVAVGSGLEDRVAFNRRAIMRDGRARTLGLRAADTDIRYIEGPIDPELGVMTFVTDEMQLVAMLLHHTCHPTHLNGTNNVSASWPGSWAQGVQRQFGPDCTPLVLNGCCGNIHCRDRLHPDFHHNDDYQHLGHILTETTMDVLKAHMVPVEHPILDFGTRHLSLPLRLLNSTEIDAARTLLAQHPEPIWKDETQTAVDWSWVYAASLLDLADRQAREPELDYEIQVFRIGNTAIVGVGGEPFVEAQLDIKASSPAYRTFLASYSNQFVGYVPTKRAFKCGGYETRTANGSKLDPVALEMIVDATLNLLTEMFVNT